jgi:uracil-DNA glycosylase
MTGEETDLERAYREKARAELDLADAEAGVTEPPSWTGAPLARTMLVKGMPGPDDLASGTALGGADGEAAAKALEALGYDPHSVIALISRPSSAEQEARSRRVRLQIEAVDPARVVSLDRIAAGDVAEATGGELAQPGVAVEWMGRTLLWVDGLEDSLVDERRKADVWKQFQGLGRA